MIVPRLGTGAKAARTDSPSRERFPSGGGGHGGTHPPELRPPVRWPPSPGRPPSSSSTSTATAVSTSSPRTTTAPASASSSTTANAAFRRPRSHYPVNSQPVSLATGDFNGDGKLDLAVPNANAFSTGNVVSILMGNGDEPYNPRRNFAVGSAPSSVVVGDFTGDGKADLVVTNTFSNNIGVLTGRGDGTFQDAVYYPTGTQPRSVASADFNGDGLPDLAVANSLNNTVGILMNRGSGTFQTNININTGVAPVYVAVGDFNHDSKAGPGRGQRRRTGHRCSAELGHVCILLGNGDGTFQDDVTYPTDVSPSSLAVTDTNGDLVDDLVVTNLGGDTVSVLVGNGNGTFKTGVASVVGLAPTAIAAGDLNGDEFPDLVVSVANGASNLAVLLNQPGASIYDGSPNQRFVAQLYLDLLNRPVDQSGLQTWSNLLDKGQSRFQVIRLIQSSPEYRGLQVRQLSQEILGREADAAGLQTHVNFLSRGGTVRQLRGLLLGSQEYFNLTGRTNAAFLQSLYQSVLSRTIDASGGATWGNRLTRGASRTTVANEVQNSLEGRQLQVGEVYQQLLRRRVDASGLDHFTSRLRQGLNGEQFLATILASEEYYTCV